MFDMHEIQIFSLLSSQINIKVASVEQQAALADLSVNLKLTCSIVFVPRIDICIYSSNFHLSSSDKDMSGNA